MAPPARRASEGPSRDGFAVTAADTIRPVQAPAPARPTSAAAGMVRRLSGAVLGRPVILASALFIVAITLAAVVVPILPLRDPAEQSVIRRLKPPDGESVFGTDRLGRDILSRVLWGAQVSLIVGVGVVAVSALFGTVVGLVSGYFRGPVSDVLLRLVDILLAFPPLILAMVMVTVLGSSIVTVVIAISLGVIPRFARVARATILAIRERDFVLASRALGASTPRIMLRHVLLNAVDPLIVLTTLLVPTAILTEAMLSFLGLGITEPTPTWGNMINNGRLVLREAPWLTIFPSAAIVLTVIAFNLLGDAVRDALDPTTREERTP
jgi:peptide/nickel transport system permease protein